MSSSDKGASASTAARRNRALASFYTLNPGIRQSVYGGAGGQENTGKVTGLTAEECCSPVLCSPGNITNFVSSDILSPQPPYDLSYNIYYDLTWDPLVGASSYTVTSSINIDLIISTGATSASVYLPTEDYGTVRTFTLTATTACGTTTATTTVNPCFLAGSLVQMADGSSRVIEEVHVGDLVLGAFGEINEVLALHRPLLGPVATMCRINGDHSTTNHHPHISVDKQFYCGDPALVSSTTYGHEHDVIDGAGVTVKRMLHGLKPSRIQKLRTGIPLKTVQGSRVVTLLETYSMPPETQLYNLVIGGSHTYHVDGYAVTGWPREDDFDYDAWVPSAFSSL